MIGDGIVRTDVPGDFLAVPPRSPLPYGLADVVRRSSCPQSATTSFSASSDFISPNKTPTNPASLTMSRGFGGSAGGLIGGIGGNGGAGSLTRTPTPWLHPLEVVATLSALYRFGEVGNETCEMEWERVGAVLVPEER